MNYYDLKIVTYNKDVQKKFKNEIVKNLNNNKYLFKEIKNLKEQYVRDFIKVFIYRDNTIMPVNKNTKPLPYGYYERLKSFNKKFIDIHNKIILLVE